MITFRREGSLVKHGLNVTFTGDPGWSIGFGWRSNYQYKSIRFVFYPREIKYADKILHKARSFKIYKGVDLIKTL